jgi:hypothetical protein
LEVLFSVIIIGVGLIMVAAMLPVAIQQTQASLSDSEAASVGRDALRDLAAAASAYQGAGNFLFPATYNPAGATPAAQYPIPNTPADSYIPNYNNPTIYGNPIVPITATGLGAITSTGNEINSADRRFGWMGFYRRDMITPPGGGTAYPSPFAQVWIFAAQARTEGQPNFSSGPGVNIGTSNFFTNVWLDPESIGPRENAQFTGSIMKFTTEAGAPVRPVVDNAYALVLNVTNPTQPYGTTNGLARGNVTNSVLIGRVIKLGNNIVYSSSQGVAVGDAKTPDGWIWNVPAGTEDFLADTASVNTFFTFNPITVFVLGSSLGPDGYTGLPQDLAVTTGYVRVGP